MLFRFLLPVVFALITTLNFSGVLLESGENFKVYDITVDRQLEYRYEIYNNDGILVKNERVWPFPSIATICDNTILSITRGVGTGTFQTQYYDIERDLFSEIFEMPFAAEHGMVVYADIVGGGFILVVRDIFDASNFYKEFELDFSPTAIPANVVYHVEFLDSKRLLLTYLSGVEHDERTAILNLDWSRS
jgi:hypothetical protein